MNRKQHNILILVLGSLTAIGPFSIDMYLPGFPAIARDLCTDRQMAAGAISSSLVSIFRTGTALPMAGMLLVSGVVSLVLQAGYRRIHTV